MMRYSVLVSASLLAVAAVATAPAVASAQSTKDKVEQKADSAADKVKETMDTAGDKAQATGEKIERKGKQAADKTKSMASEVTSDLSDSWLTAKTKIALFADERVKGLSVSVETEDATVMLRGKVDSDEAKAAAESIAEGIDGVKSVKNELQVVAPAQRAVVEASDTDIQKAVEARLARDPRMKKIDVRSDARVVTLTGEVPGIDSSARASELARGVPGVRSVKNDLTSQETGDRTGAMRDHSRAAMPGHQQHVKMTQEALKDNGYDPGPVDGIMGPQTAAALREYQRKENLTVTGRADAETLGRLGVGVGGSSGMLTGPKKKQSP